MLFLPAPAKLLSRRELARAFSHLPAVSVNWLLMTQGAKAMRLVLKVWLTRACTSITN